MTLTQMAQPRLDHAGTKLWRAPTGSPPQVGLQQQRAGPSMTMVVVAAWAMGAASSWPEATSAIAMAAMAWRRVRDMGFLLMGAGAGAPVIASVT
jgi:hypothetical protein